MRNAASLIKYFKGGSAEQERDIRGEVFVSPEDMDSLLSFDFYSSTILLGNKGVGKSIFVNVLHEAYLRSNEISVLLTADNLDCDSIITKKTLADKKSAAYGQILKAVAGSLGRYSNENEVSINADVTALQKLAISEGYSKSDIISKFARILAKSTPYGKGFAKAVLEEQSNSLGKNNLHDVVESYLTARNRNLWLFLDDLDEAVAEKSKGVFDYAACWAIISAAIDISQDVSSVRCIISVRSDIWHLMTKVHGHGSEKRDKLGKIHELKFSENELRNIFNKRLELALQDARSDQGIKSFFQSGFIKLPGLNETQRPWDQWLAKISRFRPRDMVKAVQMLIEKSKGSGNGLIGDSHAHDIMLPYAEGRIDNIFDEYGKICPQITALINDFCQKTTYSFAEVIDILKKAPSKRGVMVDGIAMQQTNDHAIRMLRILHMACFINPKLGSDDNYEHFNYNDYPDLVDMSKFSDLQKYRWQIHSAFHSYVANEKKKSRFM